MENFASSEVNGSPLCHLTPSSSLNSHVVGAVRCHCVARAGNNLPSGWRLSRLSNRLNETRMSLDDVDRCGSNREMSPPWATISSRFCVACAAARWAQCASRIPAAAAAMPAPADRRRNSRRDVLVTRLSRAIVAPLGVFVERDALLSVGFAYSRDPGASPAGSRSGMMEGPRCWQDVSTAFPESPEAASAVEV